MFSILIKHFKKLTIVRQTRVSMAPSVSAETIIMNVDVSPDLMGPNVVTVSIF